MNGSNQNTRKFLIAILFLWELKKCFSFSVENGQVTRKPVPELYCEHEEAGTHIFFHLKHIQDTHPGSNVSVRANDAHVGFILLHQLTILKLYTYLDGSGLNVTIAYPTFCRYLSPCNQACSRALRDFIMIHAFTGSDYTAAFMNKGKVKPFKIMEKSDSCAAAFSKLGAHESEYDDILPTIEEFVCKMYGQPQEKAVNDARQATFFDSYALKDINASLKKIKGAHPSSFLPCLDALTNKLKHAHFVTSVWKHELFPNPVHLNPADYGWT